MRWSQLDDGGFERLIFNLLNDGSGYENARWLMKTRAPDRGRDLSVDRVLTDSLSETRRERVIVQCKHWLSRSVKAEECADSLTKMALWEPPRVDVLVIATSGRFTADAVRWVELHNDKGIRPTVEIWPESHLETLLSARAALVGEFGLRPNPRDG